MRPNVQPTGVERKFKEDEIIVSKTDLKGILTYTNHVFCEISDYTERDLVGQSHNIIRHPDMPRSIFKLLWDMIQAGQECFAYVVNMARNGDHYWVFAHVTPTFDEQGRVLGYHSNRRVPDQGAVDRVQALYHALLAEEQKYGGDWRSGMQASGALLEKTLKESGMEYPEFVFSL